MNTRKRATFANAATLKILLTAIYKLPLTQYEIMEVTGLTNSTVSRWLALLHRRPNIVYIHSYVRHSERGCWSKRWSAGFLMQDAAPPKAMSPSQYRKRWLDKKAGISIPQLKGTVYESV